MSPDRPWWSTAAASWACDGFGDCDELRRSGRVIRMRPIHLLLSPTAGRGRAAGSLAEVRKLISDRGCDIIDITAPSAVASGAAAAAAVADGAERLVVVGGDGIVQIGVQAVSRSSTVLGVLPAGTGNDFARFFGLHDLALEQAVDLALGPARPIDAIRIDAPEDAAENAAGTADGATPEPATPELATPELATPGVRAVRDRWVASSITGGFSVEVNRRADGLSWPRGSSRYTIATLLALLRLRTRPLSLTVDGLRHERRATLFAIANTASFGGGMAICPDAAADDGALDVTMVGDLGRMELLRWFPKVFEGAHLAHPDVHTFRGRTITVEGNFDELRGDGEPLGPTPLTVSCVPGVVRLAVGPG